jgi:hypothetical protein
MDEILQAQRQKAPSTFESLMGAARDPQFYRDMGNRVYDALAGGVRDVFPTGANPGGSLAQRGVPVDPEYNQKIQNLGFAGMTATRAIVSGIGKDLVTLYHGTSKDAADSIRQSGTIKSGDYFGNIRGVSLTPNKKVAEEFGSEVIEVKIPKKRLVVDPESVDNADIGNALRDGASVYATGDVLL